MRNAFTYCLIFSVSFFIYNCNDAQQTTERKLPADTMVPDVSETKKIIPVDTKGDSLNKQTDLPISNPK